MCLPPPRSEKEHLSSSFIINMPRNDLYALTRVWRWIVWTLWWILNHLVWYGEENRRNLSKSWFPFNVKCNNLLSRHLLLDGSQLKKMTPPPSGTRNIQKTCLLGCCFRSTFLFIEQRVVSIPWASHGSNTSATRKWNCEKRHSPIIINWWTNNKCNKKKIDTSCSHLVLSSSTGNRHGGPDANLYTL